jgi:hypothetical protein
MFGWPWISNYTYICITNQYDSLFIFTTPLHASGPFVTHHQEVTPTDFLEINKYHFAIYIYIYILPPDDGLQIAPKHVELNKVKVKSASFWIIIQV